MPRKKDPRSPSRGTVHHPSSDGEMPDLQPNRPLESPPMPRKVILAAALGILALTTASTALAVPGNEGLFSVGCDLSHRLPDDPIVHPHKHGDSHSHEFYGNASTNANSNLASMRGAGTSCKRGEDRSGYWIPTLYKFGQPVAASSITVYYRTAGRDPGTIQPLPDGLQMVAGDAEAKEVQDDDIVDWSCQQGQVYDNTVLGKAGAKVHLRHARKEVRRLKKRRQAIRARGGALKAVNNALAAAQEELEMAQLDNKPSSLPSCPPGSRVHLSLSFPDCWDGQRLDSVDHKSHMFYSEWSAGEMRCPASHPIPVPAITFSISWPINDGFGARLASGPVRTMHGDVFSAWDPGTEAAIVNRCLRADLDCGSH
jgi:hypothetical protein